MREAAGVAGKELMKEGSPLGPSIFLGFRDRLDEWVG